MLLVRAVQVGRLSSRQGGQSACIRSAAEQAGCRARARWSTLPAQRAAGARWRGARGTSGAQAGTSPGTRLLQRCHVHPPAARPPPPRTPRPSAARCAASRPRCSAAPWPARLPAWRPADDRLVNVNGTRSRLSTCSAAPWPARPPAWEGGWGSAACGSRRVLRRAPRRQGGPPPGWQRHARRCPRASVRSCHRQRPQPQQPRSLPPLGSARAPAL